MRFVFCVFLTSVFLLFISLAGILSLALSLGGIVLFCSSKLYKFNWFKEFSF